jgi:hypothetical protein
LKTISIRLKSTVTGMRCVHAAPVFPCPPHILDRGRATAGPPLPPPHSGELYQTAGAVGPAQIATGCCLVAAIITANTINGAGTSAQIRTRAAASVTRLSVSWPGYAHSPPKHAGEPWSRASAGLCVCESLRRGHHVLVLRQRFKFTVTEVTGSRLKQPKSPPSQCRTVVPLHIKSGQDRNREGSVKAARLKSVLRDNVVAIGVLRAEREQ